MLSGPGKLLVFGVRREISKNRPQLEIVNFFGHNVGRQRFLQHKTRSVVESQKNIEYIFVFYTQLMRDLELLVVLSAVPAANLLLHEKYNL